LVPEGDGSAEAAMRMALAGRYATVRAFLVPLGRSMALGAASGGVKIQSGGVVRILAGPGLRR
jgi:hypothetical protein